MASGVQKQCSGTEGQSAPCQQTALGERRPFAPGLPIMPAVSTRKQHPGRERCPGPEQTPQCNLPGSRVGEASGANSELVSVAGALPAPCSEVQRKGGAEEQHNARCLNRRVLDFLAISQFRLSSSFLVTISKPQGSEAPGAAFPQTHSHLSSLVPGGQGSSDNKGSEPRERR